MESFADKAPSTEIFSNNSGLLHETDRSTLLAFKTFEQKLL